MRKICKYICNLKFKCFEGISSKNIFFTLVLNLVAVLLLPSIKLLEQQKFDVIEVLIQLLIVLVTLISSYLVIKDSFKINEVVQYFISILLLVFIAQFYVRDMYIISVIIISLLFTFFLLWGVINSYRHKRKQEIKESEETFKSAQEKNEVGGVKL